MVCVTDCLQSFQLGTDGGSTEGFGAALESSTDSPSPLQQDLPVLGSSV